MSEIDPRRYQLSASEHHRIFHEEIVREYAQATPQQIPIAILLGGQPGAGKSHAKQLLLRNFVDATPVDIGSDMLRPYHPQYAQLLRTDDRHADTYTDRDARAWVDMAMAFAIEHRYSIVLDSTLSRPETFQATAERLRDAGYHINVAMLAVPAPLSRLGNLQRYLAQYEVKGHGRFCVPETHDAAYAGVLNTAALVDQTARLADVVHVFRRGGPPLYTNVRAGDIWSQPPRAVPVISSERGRVWTESEQRAFHDALHRASAAAPEHLATEVAGIRDLAEPYLMNPGSGNAAHLGQDQVEHLGTAQVPPGFNLEDIIATVRATNAMIEHINENLRSDQADVEPTPAPAHDAAQQLDDGQSLSP